MKWLKLSEQKPEKGRLIWLFGTDSEFGYKRFDVGCNDKVYGILSNHGPSMNVTHWCYCEEPKEGG